MMTTERALEDASASAAAEPLPRHPLEAHLSALPRAPLMPFDATGRMAAAIPFAFDDTWNSWTAPDG